MLRTGEIGCEGHGVMGNPITIEISQPTLDTVGVGEPPQKVIKTAVLHHHAMMNSISLCRGRARGDAQVSTDPSSVAPEVAPRPFKKSRRLFCIG
jgi:hypothetical protein